MSDISRKTIRCAKCGKESQQLVDDKETNDKSVSYRQKCPFCGYEAFSIDISSDDEMKNKLSRDEIIRITEEFIDAFNEYEIFGIPNELYLDYFKKIEEKLNIYHFEEDSRFVTYGRLAFLKEELTQRLADDTLRYEEPNSVWGKNKWDNRMGAFIDLWDYIRGDRYIARHQVPEGDSFKDVLLSNDQYYKEGLICKQERDILLDMINEMKNFISPKKLIFKIEDHDWGLKTIFTWNTKKWYIYNDLSIIYEITNGQNRTKSYSHSISDENLNLITQNIELAKSDNRVVDACDGEAWQFIQYEDGNVVWERELGYIYGIDSLVAVSNILLDLVKNDSDIFIDEEMEENNTGLFNKHDKYNIDEKDNRPQIVYGIPDNLRNQWEKEEKEKTENNKYNIKPEDNMPREVYGIPDFIRNKDKYDINPENNVPQRVYGIPNVRDINSRKCPFCGSMELRKYLYGEPSFDYDENKYILGGCEITGNQPTHKCKKCGKNIYPDTNFIMPGNDNLSKESIRIGIQNKKNNYVLSLNHLRESETYDLLFADLNKLSGKVISEISTNVPERYYSQFVSKLYNIISDWKDVYPGESNIIWSVEFDTEHNTRSISGNGSFPSNWNEFIDLISEYEKIFKNKKKIDQDIENKLSFTEAINSKLEDSFWAELVIKYFKEEEKVNDFVGKLLFKALSRYDDILNEFIKYLNQRTYDLKDAIEISGYTAKKIHELNPKFSPSGVYTFMEALRSDPTKAEEIIKSGFKNKDVLSLANVDSGNNSVEKEMLKEIEGEVDK